MYFTVPIQRMTVSVRMGGGPWMSLARDGTQFFSFARTGWRIVCHALSPIRKLVLWSFGADTESIHRAALSERWWDDDVTYKAAPLSCIVSYPFV